MQIPSRNECMALLSQMDMPEHMQRHSLMVAEIASYLSGLLNRNSVRLDLRLVEAAALLHDIGKPESLSTGEDHGVSGARILEGLGYPVLAPIVREHITLDMDQVEGPITESLIVNYSDKRVRHDQVVTVQERFEDLIARYAKTSAHHVRMHEKLDIYLELERRIFDHLTIVPTGSEIMGLTAGLHP
jgi:uncharacterized protein